MFLFFSFSIYLVKEMNFLFYNSTDSPDFDTYSVYFEYLFKNLSSTGREQGLFYYYLHSWYFYFNYGSYENYEFFTLLHRSIQEVNFIFFLIGLLGIYLLLRLFKFSYYSSILSLIFINFLPASIAQRIVFKPEILTFAVLPWIIICIEKYKNQKKISYLFLALPLLIISLTSKGSIFAIVSLYLFIYFFKDFLNVGIKNVFSLILIFTILISLLVREDVSSNGQSLIEVESGSTMNLNYDYKAPLSVIYKVHLYELVSNPIKHNHADSFIAISLLDTFGDYFDIYWDNDSSLYSKDRREILKFEQSQEIKAPKYDSSTKTLTIYLQNLTETYYRKFFSMVLTACFYILLLRQIRLDKKLRKFLIAPVIGMSLILFHIISGFPVNNFNPEMGDTLKPLYYSYLIVLAGAFLAAKIFEKNYLTKLFIIPYIFIILLLIGFPKDVDYEMQRDISQINNYSATCSLNNIFLSRLGYDPNKECLRTGVNAQIEYDFMSSEGYKKKPRFKFIHTTIGIFSLVSLLILSLPHQRFKNLLIQKN